MALANIKQLTDAIFYAKEKPELLFKLLFPLVRDNAVNTVIRMSGQKTLALNATNPVTTTAPVVEIFDQYAIPVTGASITFAIKSAVTGCTVNSSTGVLTATAAVAVGAKPVVVATCGSLTAELQVTILGVPTP